MIIKWGKRLWDYFFNPCPTLFDLCVCIGVIGIAIVRPVLRGWYLEFFTIFLVIVGFNYKQKRQFNSGSLSILCILGLISLSVHSFYTGPGTATFQYLNFYLMHEGFAYIFYSCLLFYIVTTKATNLRLLIFTLPIAAIPWMEKMLYCGQMTPVLALGVGFVIYLLCVRKFKIAILLTLIALNVVAWNYEWLLMKFEVRPHVWGELFRLIQNPPYVGSFLIAKCQGNPLNFIVGSGFNKLYVPDNMLTVSTWGNTWLFRHNDLLSMMAYIGAFSIIPLVMFIKKIFSKLRNTWMIAPAIAFLVLCLIQVTFVYPDRVLIILLSLSWFYLES